MVDYAKEISESTLLVPCITSWSGAWRGVGVFRSDADRDHFLGVSEE